MSGCSTWSVQETVNLIIPPPHLELEEVEALSLMLSIDDVIACIRAEQASADHT